MIVWIPTAAATAEIIFFPLAAAAAIFGLRPLHLESHKKRMLLGAMVFSVLAKIALASLGHNYDVDSARLISDILAQGKSVYANTSRYNYGPIWAWLIAGFGRLAGPGAGESFHMWMAAFLAMIDVLIAVAIARVYSWAGAMVFLLSPIGLLITGFHSQFDNLAVLMGLLAWLQIRNGQPKRAALILSAVCLGVSLIVKHILFLFPIWLVFWRPLGKLRYRILYAAIAYGLFAGVFLVWWSDPASRDGIVKNVFGYKSAYGMSWLGYVIELFLPVHSLDSLLSWIPGGSGLKTLWMGLMALMGATLVRKGVRELYLFYLMLLYASSPAMATQYVAIPMLAAAVFYPAWEGWAFVAAATFANLLAKSNVGYLLFQAISRSGLMLVRGHPYNLSDLLDVSAVPFFLAASQFCVGALFLKQWRQIGKPAVTIPLWIKMRQAAILIAAGGLPVVVSVVRKTMTYGSLGR